MKKILVVACAMLAALALSPFSVAAHCDSLDGPVVHAAKEALTEGDVTPVMKWVRPEDESTIEAAFQKTMGVRSLGEDARELADLYFFETLVRIHRQAEGAPYTGLKPEGTAEPGITLADDALASGSADALLRQMTELVRHGIHERFERASAAKERAGESVPLGREYVSSYVEFIHYVAAIHDAASMESAHRAHD